MNQTSQIIRSQAPVLFELLSELGRVAEFPADIPFQAAEAKGKKLNATIGQITDGQGHPMPLEPMASALASLQAGDRDRAFLYSPVAGIEELRQRWRDWQRRDVSGSEASSLPIVTVGLTHGLSLVADLFAGQGRPIAVAKPFWGNYAQTFRTRTGAKILSAPAYVDRRFNAAAIAEALTGVQPGVPAVAILNLPSNPCGYMPTAQEREDLRSSLIEIAELRPLLVVCDDAYQGLVYEGDIPQGSMFWDLLGAHENLLPVKVDGATKELSFFGGRVGFLTFPFEPESPVASAIESKVKCLLRATVGSPVSTCQVVALAALRSSALGAEVERIRLLLAARYQRLKKSLGSLDESRVKSLPFNAGCFS
ncbi:MAG: aminotransferase class I/II-fold pyridoxal phosphate-dependent enzyme, partial [Acidobacteriota bacterium]